MAQLTVIQADCVEYLKTLDDNTFDSVVTDPPVCARFHGQKLGLVWWR
jgi:23S rRNA G2069 N7-methylase RlmK/C1962 C5-methylase RlmI